jgi:hypothetical protein
MELWPTNAALETNLSSPTSLCKLDEPELIPTI